MTRTAVQALWNHMPDQPYNWGNRASVIGRTPRQVTPLDIPEAWVAPQLRRLIRPFAQQRSGIPNSAPELEIIERGQYQLVQAEDLRAERFPNTYLCRTCGQFTNVRLGDDAPACRAGHGTMAQFQFAEVHNCGLLRELRPPRCANGCRCPDAAAQLAGAVSGAMVLAVRALRHPLRQRPDQVLQRVPCRTHAGAARPADSRCTTRST